MSSSSCASQSTVRRDRGHALHHTLSDMMRQKAQEDKLEGALHPPFSDMMRHRVEKDKMDFDTRLSREREQTRSLETVLNDIRARSTNTTEILQKAYAEERVRHLLTCKSVRIASVFCMLSQYRDPAENICEKRVLHAQPGTNTVSLHRKEGSFERSSAKRQAVRVHGQLSCCVHLSRGVAREGAVSSYSSSAGLPRARSKAQVVICGGKGCSRAGDCSCASGCHAGATDA